MKRMIYIWLSLIVLLFAVGFIRPDWSVFVNTWTMVVLTLVLLLLSIEFGLYFWRRRMLELSETIKNGQLREARTEQEDHYIPPTSSG